MRHLLLGILAVVSWQSALACSCRPWKSYEQWVERIVNSAEEIVQVRVIDSGDRPDDRVTRTVVLAPLMSTTTVGDEIEVFSRRSSATCGVTLHDGEEWVLLMRNRRVSLCSGSTPIANLRPERLDPADPAGDAERRQERGRQFLSLLQAEVSRTRSIRLTLDGPLPEARAPASLIGEMDPSFNRVMASQVPWLDADWGQARD